MIDTVHRRHRTTAVPPRGADGTTEGMATLREREAGWTPRELARILRVSPDRVRGWIASGELPALNLARHRSGRPRYVILPDHLRQFEAGRRTTGPPPKPTRRPRLPTGFVDFFPGD
jgi:hypothetical protein